MRMINIYCLIHPVTRHPFYVGATNQRISVRLSGHLGEHKTYLQRFWSEKMKVINEMIISGNKPKVRLLKTVTIHEADYYEAFFYDLFIQQGYNLIQDNRRFHYKSQKTNSRFFKKEYQQVVLHSHYCCKNIFGNK